MKPLDKQRTTIRLTEERAARYDCAKELFEVGSWSRAIDRSVDVAIALSKNGQKIPFQTLIEIVGREDLAKFVKERD